MTGRDGQKARKAALCAAPWVALLAFASTACGSDDRAGPSLVDALFLPPSGGPARTLGAADATAPLDGELVTTPTEGTVRAVFSEALDGASVQTADRNAHGQLVEWVGRVGIARIAPVDGSLVASSVRYRAELRAIDITTDVPSAAGYRVASFMPADTMILVHLLADRIADRDANLLTAARLDSGEPVRDADGREVGATIAFATEPLDVRGVMIPDYGAIDDPTTPEDETVPYDAMATIEFNTAIDALSADGRVHLVRPGMGFLPARVQATPTPAGVAATAIEVWPDAPLDPNTEYELRIEPGVTDAFGVPLTGEPRHFAFTTR